MLLLLLLQDDHLLVGYRNDRSAASRAGSNQSPVEKERLSTNNDFANSSLNRQSTAHRTGRREHPSVLQTHLHIGFALLWDAEDDPRVINQLGFKHLKCHPTIRHGIQEQRHRVLEARCIRRRMIRMIIVIAAVAREIVGARTAAAAVAALIGKNKGVEIDAVYHIDVIPENTDILGCRQGSEKSCVVTILAGRRE
jgi:hypothetical protein